MIIMSKGDAMTPARFWSYIVCESDEKERNKCDGYVVTHVRKYLKPEQIKLLVENKGETNNVPRKSN